MPWLPELFTAPVLERIRDGVEVAFAMNAKASNTAVREDVEAKVREWRRGLHSEQVPRVALER